MRTAIRLLVGCLCLLFFTCVITFGQNAPNITSIAPSVGAASPVGSPVSIKGAAFGTSQGSSVVTFGDITVTPTSWTDTKIVAPVPGSLPVGFADVSVTVGGVTSNTNSFLVIPVITRATPSSAPVGTPVTLDGSSFGGQQGTSTVTFNGVTAMPTSWSNTSITVPVPSGATYGPIVITVNGFQTNGLIFPVLPNIVALSPNSGQAGSSVTISGTTFEQTQGFGGITFNGVPATVQSWSDTSISAVLPSGATTGNVVVQTGRLLNSNGANFTVIAPPAVSAVTPASGIVGTQIAISGSNFGASQGQIAIGGQPMTVSSWNDTSILASILPGAASGNLVVTTSAGLSSSGTSFTVLPAISTIFPASGLVGTQVTVTGSGFGAIQGAGQIRIGGQAMTVSSWSDTGIVAAISTGAVTGNVVVTTDAGFSSNGTNFAVTFPMLQVSVSDTPLNVSLTSSQNLDWVHWGRLSASIPDRKDGVTPLISDYTSINGALPSASSGVIAFSWSDGNHSSLVSETTADVETSNAGGGFQIAVPADTTAKTLTLYLEVSGGTGMLQASLSDGSAASITDQPVTDLDFGSKTYSIDFRAASSGQTLTVSFSAAAGATVGLQAATLTPHLPLVSIVSPVAAQQLAAPASVPVNVNASQFDTSIADVKATGSDGTVFDNPGVPLSINWGPLVGGHYSITATAIDTTGLTGASNPVEFDVIGQGGALSIDEVAPSSPVDLDGQGSADWVLWGPLNTGDSIIDNPGHILARKSGVAPLIAEYRPIGNHFINSVAFAHNLCFAGNQQNYCSGSELVVHSHGNGFELNVAADTNLRTLQLYVGTVSADAKVVAFLSDGSAPVATEIGGSGPPNPANTTLYTINYIAASSGQTLTVRFILDTDQGDGQINLIGATLSGPPVAPSTPSPQITSVTPTNAPTDARITITGDNFGATQGDSYVMIGDQAQVVSWSDTSIAAIVPATLAAGSTADVTVFTDHGVSNTATLNILSYKIFPATINLLVGQARTLAAKDDNGNPVIGLPWSTSDSTIIRFSNDDPPVITAIAPGSAKVWAGDISVPVTVYAGTTLPPDTPIWTLPLGSGGSSSLTLAAAVPSDNGADILALDDSGTLTATMSDGTPIWEMSGIPGGSSAKLIPDFSGSALVKSPLAYIDSQFNSHSTHIVKAIDPNTRQLSDLYTFAEKQVNSSTFSDASSIEVVIPHPIGPVFIQDNTSVSVLESSSGVQISTVMLDNSTVGSTPLPPIVIGKMIVAGDGSAYVPYAYENKTFTGSFPDPNSTHTVFHLKVLRVSPDGGTTKTELTSWTIDTNCVPWTTPSGATGQHCTSNAPNPSFTNASAITNINIGVAIFETHVLTGCTDVFTDSDHVVQESGCPDSLAHTDLSYVTHDAVSGQFPDAIILPNDTGRDEAFVPALQRADGTFIGTDTTSEIFGFSNLLAVGSDGGVLWKQSVSSTPTVLTPQYVTPDGGVMVQSKQVQNCQLTPPQCQTLGTPILYTLDEDGNAIGQDTDFGTVSSWTGKSYIGLGSMLSQAVLPIVVDELSFWAQKNGNPSDNGVAIPLCPCVFQSASSAPTATVTTQATSQDQLLAGPALSTTAIVAPSTPSCPLCALQTPQCLTMDGNQSTFLLIMGDPGLTDHNTGNLFYYAAQQKANDLQKDHHRVVACRASSIQDFDNALLQHGLIDGGVIYFGHSGVFSIKDIVTHQTIGFRSILAIGETSAPNTNLTITNMSLISNVRTALCSDGNNPACNIIGPNAAILISGCEGGTDVGDFITHQVTSIAQEISNQTKRGVFGYDVGLYFSHLDAVSDGSYDGRDPVTGKTIIIDESLPMFMVPVGKKGHKLGPILFTPSKTESR